MIRRERLPEAELVTELRGVATIEERLEEARRLGVLLGLGVRQPEVERVPTRLLGDGLDDVGVDLRQRMVARERAERPREARVAARVVERVPGLMEERLIVGEPALRARDQVDDLRRVGRDHASARVLLWPILEVEPAVRDRPEIEAQRANRLDTHLDGAVLGVRRLERREAPQPAEVRARGQLGVRRAEQALEPTLAQPRVLVAGGVRRPA